MAGSSSKRRQSIRNNENGDAEDDFVILDEPTDLPIRSKRAKVDWMPSIEVNPIDANNSILVSVIPPKKPIDDIQHVPCDIVLVIDVSGSMAALAPLPDVEDPSEREASGLTVLDLVKHACRTIISTLNAGDRLALVEFSREAKVVQSLTNMTDEAKVDVVSKVEKLKDQDATNLWAGIKAGLQQFEQYPPVGNVQGLYVLTDGQPNYLCPPQGYVPKLKPLLKNLFNKTTSAPTIQTFGFGYGIQSDLMLSIAHAGHGNYAFIPDVGMIGTVFVHAVANHQATFASNVTLEVSIADDVDAKLQHRSGLPNHKRLGALSINLGSLLYGQSRDLVITHSPQWAKKGRSIDVKMVCTPHGRPTETVQETIAIPRTAKLSQATIDYHKFRDELCNFFWTLYPKDLAKGGHKTARNEVVNSAREDLDPLIKGLDCLPDIRSNENLSSLLADIIGRELDVNTPHLGQIYQALSNEPNTTYNARNPSYWQKWGRHYLSSLCCAHMRQTCNSFKDAGPLRYGVDSEIFIRCRDELDAAFDNLPAPVGSSSNDRFSRIRGGANNSNNSNNNNNHIPSGVGMMQSCGSMVKTAPTHTPINMHRYNRRDNVCFLGTCSITLTDAQNRTTYKVAVQDARIGDLVVNPLTQKSRRIAGIVKNVRGSSSSNTHEHRSLASTRRPNQRICRVFGTDLWITPWHPVFVREVFRGMSGSADGNFVEHNKKGQWTFPTMIAEESRLLRKGEHVYSIILDRSNDPDDHVVEVGGMGCVTLGHGLVDQLNEEECGELCGGVGMGMKDVRNHPFWGDYEAVMREFGKLDVDEAGRWPCAGLVRGCGGSGKEGVGKDGNKDGDGLVVGVLGWKERERERERESESEHGMKVGKDEQKERGFIPSRL